jgi:hypothetical protein
MESILSLLGPKRKSTTLQFKYETAKTKRYYAEGTTKPLEWNFVLRVELLRPAYRAACNGGNFDFRCCRRLAARLIHSTTTDIISLRKNLFCCLIIVDVPSSLVYRICSDLQYSTTSNDTRKPKQFSPPLSALQERISLAS